MKIEYPFNQTFLLLVFPLFSSYHIPPSTYPLPHLQVIYITALYPSGVKYKVKVSILFFTSFNIGEGQPLGQYLVHPFILYFSYNPFYNNYIVCADS